MSSIGRHAVTLVGVGTLLVSTAVARAQEPRALQLGSRVRISVVEGSRAADPRHGWGLTGTLLGISDTSLTLETSPGRPPVVVSRPTVVSLELNTRRSQRKKGALIGLAVGVAAGLISAAAESCPPPKEYQWLDLCESFSGPLVYATAGGVLGAAGAGIGALVAPGEKWETLAMDRVRVAVSRAHGGIRLGVSLGF